MSLLPANRTGRHIPAFPLSGTKELPDNPLPPFFPEKYTHDTADLISGGDLTFTGSQNLTLGEDLAHFRPVKLFVVQCCSRCKRITVPYDALDLV